MWCSHYLCRLLWIITVGVQLTASAFAGERTITLPDKSKVKAIYSHVTVPLRRDIESNRTITIPYIHLLARSKSKKPPVIVLEYGPTGAGTQALAENQMGKLLSDLLLTRDVIFLDQRGTGENQTVLDCFAFHDFPPVPAPSGAELQAAANRITAICAETLRARGTDLAAYNINESADDIADLAAHLGAKKVALKGSSHGSRLALNVIRRHKDLVERALVTGVTDTRSGFFLSNQLDDLLLALDEIAADPRTRWPLHDPPSRAVRKALRAFDEPKRLTYVDIYDRKTEVEVSRQDATRHLFRYVGTRASWQRLPTRLAKFSRNDGLEELARQIKKRRRFVGLSPTTIANQCMTWASKERLLQMAQQKKTSVGRDILFFPAPDVCQWWGLKPLPADLRTPITSDVPVLMISGELDHRTPVADADRIAASLKNAVQIKIANMGHEFRIAYEGISAVRSAVLGFMSGKRVDDARHSIPFKFDKLD